MCPSYLIDSWGIKLTLGSNEMNSCKSLQEKMQCTLNSYYYLAYKNLKLYTI